ncbi:MAG TPA: peptidoglycan DD-metalloendopeptidase family protein [Actinomycetota bacterium]|nr:peptidoglycan DD-metalloendopeptidase family protein [Actinomycetota bacterium]
MPDGRISRAARFCAAAVLTLSAVTALTGPAAGDETASLREQMQALQARLDETATQIEDLRTQREEIEHRLVEIDARKKHLTRVSSRLQAAAIERADVLYRTGAIGMVEVLFTSDDFGELQERAELLSQVSLEDTGVFIRLLRNREELARLDEELVERNAELAATEDALAARNAALQRELRDAEDEWAALQASLGGGSNTSVAAIAPVLSSTRGMYCPVAGPNSFVDSWGAPRSGHTHQGVDIMAAYGTPIVAVTSGTITYAAYDGSGGNMIFLSGDDGHSYWYMHNQENLVSGGHVSAGQQIATVGDTGNAAGTPHLHFEYHPGGGAAVNPYPLAASLCH